MTVVPLPDVPCVRVKLDYQDVSGFDAGSRFFLSYSGSAPTGANCTTLAGDVATAWAANIAPLVTAEWSLKEVDVLDIATNSGFSGQATPSDAGTRTGPTLPLQCATNVEYNISRRYRGGKPRMFLPPGAEADLVNQSHYDGTYVTAVNTGITAFFAALEALSIGAMGTLAHVNLSYYSGFRNVTNSSGRERAVPVYRPTALHDVVSGYSCKALVGSQRRRRTATSY